MRTKKMITQVKFCRYFYSFSPLIREKCMKTKKENLYFDTWSKRVNKLVSETVNRNGDHTHSGRKRLSNWPGKKRIASCNLKPEWKADRLGSESSNNQI